MNYPHASWRLLVHEPASGSWNMAVDEALLESVGEGVSAPVLRLYSWDPPCLSLGYAQSITDVDLIALQQNGWLLVRRPTGGRAILHTDELTYAVIAPLNEPRISGGVVGSYRRLSIALLDALQRLAIPAQATSLSALDNPAEQSPVCFEVPSHYEITVAGKKLIGSAQVRRKASVLQHGSLPLCGDLTRITQALKFPDVPARQAAAQRLTTHATTMEAILGAAPDWDQTVLAFRHAFENTLNITLVPSTLDQAEISRAARLEELRFSSSDWTFRM